MAERGVLGFVGGGGDLVYRSGANNMTNGLERFRVKQNGFFGIGSDNPYSRLTLSGNELENPSLLLTNTSYGS